MLFYLPLEPQKNRYSWQLSTAKTGWMERNWIKAEVPHTRVEGVTSDRVGRILDPVGRTQWCFGQVNTLLAYAETGQVKDSDVIYFEDFFHPGIEALFYAFHQFGISPRFYTNCWAQSVDQFDFTFPMRRWMRPYEKMVGRVCSGVFVATPMLKDLLAEADVCDPSKIHAVGHPWDTEEVVSRMPKWIQHKTDLGGMRSKSGRKDQVVFSSRWDKEKNPDFFLNVVRAVAEIRPDVTFVVCTSTETVKSNDPALIGLLNIVRKEYPKNLVVKENLTKEQYYEVLAESKVQFNCADQDWISYTLLEASTAGCYPVYPNFRSFPEVLNHNQNYLYQHKSVENAATYILTVLDPKYDDLWKPDRIEARSWIHRRYDGTWYRMLRKMVPDFPVPTRNFTAVQLESFARDPYAPQGRPTAPDLS